MNLTSEKEHGLQHEMQADRTRFIVYLKVLYLIGETLIALGIASNFLVCFVMVNGRKIFKPSVANCLIFHLAIADLVFRVVGVAGGITDGLNKVVVSPLQCKLFIFSQGACAAVIFFLLAEIAVDRYLHVVYPLRSLRLKWPKAKTILLTWAFAILVCFAFLFTATNKRFVRTYHVSTNTSQSSRTTQRKSKQNIVFDLQTDDCITGNPKFWTSKMSTTVFLLFAFLIPFFIMTLCYGKILIFLWRRTRMGTINSAVARSKYKATRMLILVVITALISWGPLTVMDTFQSCFEMDVYFGVYPARPLLLCFSYTTSVVNPVIYAFGNSNFRKELKRAFGRSRRVVTFRRN